MAALQFYTDSACLDISGQTTGPPDGTCTPFGTSPWRSFRVLTLQRTCSVTIYSSDVAYCSSKNIFIASFGACMTNATVNQFSVDCADYAIATHDSPASYVGSSATGTGSTATSPSTAAIHDASLSTGARAGIGVGTGLGAVIVIAILAYLVVRSKRRKKTEQTLGVAEAPASQRVHEIHGDNKRPEMAAGTCLVEAQGDHEWPASELDASTVVGSSDWNFSRG